MKIANLATSVTTTLGRTLALGTDYVLTGSTVALTKAGFALFNTLAQGVSDQAVFSYDAKDFLDATTADTLTLTINGANDAPVAKAIAGSVGEDEQVLA